MLLPSTLLSSANAQTVTQTTATASSFSIAQGKLAGCLVANRGILQE
ncbi:hypothetical protein PR003_g30268 [Phytophthora rubi]|uniref:Uncharacterized protein n=1 Tax=Phytophthora rubi TaxID=129364 RepID=A0A6A3HBV2_9STRA|nr:hypothetical protein PR001_g28423 [Phytophthora rubi]KAE9272235.1 hypothetical protein PR003_g30268 [Phytophthora rubi]